MATYHIEPERRTLHGHFSRDLPPVLTIESGDTVVFKTLEAGWRLQPPTGPGVAAPMFEPRDPALDKGHALCGPIAIRGAQPGMTLQVEIRDVRPGPFGLTFAGGWSSELNDRLGVSEQGSVILWELDADSMLGRNQLGHTIALHPFMGVMGMPPNEPGIHPTAPPRPCGGNIDCKELVASATLYLPVSVPGALFSTGDGHGAQGDGESATTALECPMDRVELAFSLNEEMRLGTPRALTSEGWVCMGFDKDLDEAAAIALDAMLGFIGEQYSLNRTDALALASVVVDLRVTQLVNGVKGVHAVLPHGAIK